MKIFFDTNVLLSSVLEQHAFHDRSLKLFTSVVTGQNKGFISSHSLAEMYSGLTRIPPTYRHGPEAALLSIEHNVLSHFQLVTLQPADYPLLIREAAAAGIQGGTIYDFLLLKCAKIAAVDQIVTLNLKHFSAIASADIKHKISEP